MTETEKILRKEIMKLELQVEDLKRKVKVANDANYAFYLKNQDLSQYIKQMENVTYD